LSSERELPEHYCTFFDRNYISGGLALYDSLRRHAGPFVLWILCFDTDTSTTLRRLALPELRVIDLADFERGDDALLAAKQNRSRVEYYFTCTPSLPLYVFRQSPSVERVTYVDADLWFFADPAPIYHELGVGSVGIVAHRFPEHLKVMERHGIYNVGLLVFRRTTAALECLTWWREQCLEWCYDRSEPGRYGDQKYLDDWPSRFEGVLVLEHPGVGLAPWNLSRYDIEHRGGKILVDGKPLIFYHFHRLLPVNRWVYVPSLPDFGHELTHLLKKRVYAPYIRALQRAADTAREANPDVAGGRSLRFRVNRLRQLPGLILRRQLLIVAGPVVI
jgi:hypothetical protein